MGGKNQWCADIQNDLATEQRLLDVSSRIHGGLRRKIRIRVGALTARPGSQTLQPSTRTSSPDSMRVHCSRIASRRAIRLRRFSRFSLGGGFWRQDKKTAHPAHIVWK